MGHMRGRVGYYTWVDFGSLCKESEILAVKVKSVIQCNALNRSNTRDVAKARDSAAAKWQVICKDKQQRSVSLHSSNLPLALSA